MASMLRALASFALLVPAGLTLTLDAGEVHAEKSKKAKGAGRACILRGTTEVPKDLAIFATNAGNKEIARFSGVELKLKVTDFPRDKDGRVWVETGDGKGNVRVDGWVDADQIPIYTKRMIPVVPGHIWIGEKRDVRFDGSRPGKLRIKKIMKNPVAQTFRGWAGCSSFTLTQGVPPGPEVDGEARGYRMRKDSIVLYDDYGRDKEEIATLYKSVSGNEVVFWSTKSRGSYVQVAYQGEILIEAWAKRYDMKSLPKGELMDQQSPPRKLLRRSVSPRPPHRWPRPLQPLP